MLYDCAQRHHIEGVVEHFPEGQSYSVLALIVEPKETIDAGGLVVSSEQKHVFRKFDFVAEEENHALDGLGPPVDIIPQKDITYLSGVARHFEYVSQILQVPVDVSYYFERRLQLQHQGLIVEDVPGR